MGTGEEVREWGGFSTTMTAIGHKGLCSEKERLLSGFLIAQTQRADDLIHLGSRSGTATKLGEDDGDSPPDRQHVE